MGPVLLKSISFSSPDLHDISGLIGDKVPHISLQQPDNEPRLHFYSTSRLKRRTRQNPIPFRANIMPVTLNGSCHCGTVRFVVESSTPVPYQLCACSICRKVGGYGGSVNLGAWFETLKILQGESAISKYTAVMNRDTPEEKLASSERSFCSKCSTMLWLWDKHWPELCHPFSSAIDSPLKTPVEMVCVMKDSKPDYVRWPDGPKQIYGVYGIHTLEEWHKENGEWVE